jgi:tetratricopeptide (TPR) repeat protein
MNRRLKTHRVRNSSVANIYRVRTQNFTRFPSQAASNYKDAARNYKDAVRNYKDAARNYKDAVRNYKDAVRNYKDAVRNYKDAVRNSAETDRSDEERVRLRRTENSASVPDVMTATSVAGLRRGPPYRRW